MILSCISPFTLQHIAFVQSIARDVQPAHLKHTHPMNTPGLSSAFHKYDHRKQRAELLKSEFEIKCTSSCSDRTVVRH